MDKLDRNLKFLPRHIPSADLAVRICATVHQRHRLRVTIRRLVASALAMIGLVLASPGFSWVAPDLFSSGVPWLSGSLGMFELESVQAVQQLWNDVFSLQSLINSSVVVSVWLGILLMGIGLSAVMDRRVFLPPMNTSEKGFGSG
jgi:hypothetical protein